MAAVFDYSDGASRGNATTITISDFIVGSGSDRLLVVSAGAEDFDLTSTVVSTITFNGVNMTFVRREEQTGGQDLTSEVWHTLGPTNITADIVATFGGECSSLKLSAMSFTGIISQSAEAQTGGIDTSDTGIPSGSTITSITDNALIVAECMHSIVGDWTAGMNYMLGTSTSLNASSMGDEYDLDGGPLGSITVDLNKAGTAGRVAWIALAYEIVVPNLNGGMLSAKHVRRKMHHQSRR